MKGINKNNNNNNMYVILWCSILSESRDGYDGISSSYGHIMTLHNDECPESNMPLSRLSRNNTRRRKI